MVNIQTVNLNLLVVFDAVMRTRSTTKAGVALGLSQSAVSNSLAQLRHIVGDPLFVRSRVGMSPTPRADEMAQPVRDAIEKMRQALACRTFDPMAAERTFVIGATDYGALVLLRRLASALVRRSSAVKLHIKDVSRPNLHAAIDNDEVDLCVAFSAGREDWHDTKLLFHDDWVCAAASSQQLPANLSLPQYLEFEHIVVGEDLSNHIDKVLSRFNQSRINRIAVPYCLVAPTFLEETKCLLTLPRRLAAAFAENADIQIRDLPFPTKGFDVNMIWHKKYSQDASHKWIRSLLEEASLQNSTATFGLPSDPGKSGNRTDEFVQSLARQSGPSNRIARGKSREHVLNGSSGRP